MITILQCKHKFCKACIAGHFKSTLYDNHIGCPGLSNHNNRPCSIKFSQEEVHQYIQMLSPKKKQSLLERYGRITLRRFLKTLADFRSCPNGECHGGEFYCGEGTTVLQCMTCKAQYCSDCSVKREYHEGMSCKEVQVKYSQSPVELQTQEYVKKIAKNCPACNAPIEKATGCAHMVCKGCEYEFCWICMQSYSDGHIRENHSTISPAARPANSFTVLNSTNQIQTMAFASAPTTFNLMSIQNQSNLNSGNMSVQMQLPNSTTVSSVTVAPKVVTSSEISQLFTQHQPITRVRVLVQDPITKLPVYKNGILLAKRPTAATTPSSTA
jgi:hypothetical protein